MSGASLLGDRPIRRIGLGCMGMTYAFAPDPASDAFRDVVAAAMAEGSEDASVLVDTADVYGPENETIVGDALRATGGTDVLVATKGGLVRSGQGTFDIRPDGRPEHLRAAVDASLARLGVERIDLYQLHRVDPEVPLDESWGALSELVTGGKIRALGLPDAEPAELERAHALHPAAAVQIEISLPSTATARLLAPWCEKFGVTLIGYGPLTKGLFTGAVRPDASFDPDDVRSVHPSFAPERADVRRRQVEAVRTAADLAGSSPAQAVLKYLLGISPNIVLIPGTRRIARWRENSGAADVTLPPQAVQLLDSVSDLVDVNVE